MEYHNEILNSKSMKLKKISILFILLPLCIFFTACSKENDNAPKQSENIIDFEQGNMNFTEGAGEQTFSLYDKHCMGSKRSFHTERGSPLVHRCPYKRECR